MRKYYILICLVFSSQFVFTQTWETLESMPSAAAERHHPAAFSVGGTGYVMGGAESNSNALGDFYSYDPIADSWTTKTDFPGQPRGFGYAVSSDTKGYVGFGYDYDAGTGDEAYLKDLWEYDPLTDNWTQLAECPGSARVHPAMVYLDGKIYMGCGGNTIGDVDDWWEYDIGSDTWTAKTDFPGDARHHPYYFALDGYVYVGMGHSGPNIYNDFYRYDPNTDSWTQMGNLPDQGRVAGTQFTYDGKGYFLSGQGENHQNLPTGEFWEYEPGTDSWTELTAHPGGGRWAPGSFVINGGVYLLCGESNSGVEKDMMRYQIEGFANVRTDELDELTVYPNPSMGTIKISGITAATELTLVDVHGKKVWTGKIHPQASIDLSFLDAGIYFCNVTEDGVLRREKLIIE
ncbi:MAG: kelch repeat-containing protein [Crocinitomicaceae bacterium]